MQYRLEFQVSHTHEPIATCPGVVRSEPVPTNNGFESFVVAFCADVTLPDGYVLTVPVTVVQTTAPQVGDHIVVQQWKYTDRRELFYYRYIGEKR